MTTPGRPNTGSSVPELVGNQQVWFKLTQMMSEWEMYGFAGKSDVGEGYAEVELNGSNPSTTENIESFRMQQLKTLDQVDGAADADIEAALRYGPTWDLEDPVWHTEIRNLIPIIDDVMPEMVLAVSPNRYMTVPVTKVKDDDGYVMLDPADPTQLLTADAGIYRILDIYDTGTDGNDYAVVDTQVSQNLWRVELTESPQTHPNTTTAKLLRLDGDDYGGDVEITDPDALFDDLSSGDKGWVLHVDNKFYAIQAPCP